MKLILKKDSTSQTALVFIQDKTAMDGKGLAGLAYDTATLTWYYYREGQGTGATAVAPATMTLGTWATRGFIEVDATDMPGWYEIGIPNAALATGASFVGMQLKGAGNMAQLNIEIQLVDVDLEDTVRMGLTALPNAAAAAAGGLLILGSNNTAAITVGALTAGAFQCSTFTATGAVALQSTLAVTGTTTLTGAVSMPAGLAANITGNITGTLATVTNLTNAPTNGDLTATMKTSVQTAADAAVTANTLITDIHTMIEGIAVTGSALSVVATAATVTTGTETLTYVATNLLDGIVHTLTVAGTTIDVYYDFTLPNASGVPSAVDVAGWLQEGAPAGGDTIDMYAYNWGGVAFEVIKNAAFTGITTAGPIQNVTVDLLARHVETGTNKVRIRFQKATLEAGTTLNIDQMMVHYAEAVAANIALIKTKTDFLPSATAGNAGGVFIAGTNAATAITTALTADITGNLSGSVGSVTTKTGYALSATGLDAIASTATGVQAIVDGVWDEATATHGTAGTTGKALTDAGAAGNPWSADTASNTAAGSFGLALGTTLQTSIGDVPTAIENADALLARDIGSGSGAGTLNERTVRAGLRALRNKWTNAAGTYTVTKEDDVTTAWTSVVTTDAAAVPIIGSDPA